MLVSFTTIGILQDLVLFSRGKQDIYIYQFNTADSLMPNGLHTTSAE